MVTGSPFATGDPVGVAVTPDGGHLYVTNVRPGSVSAFSIAADGGLSAVTGSPFATGRPVPGGGDAGWRPPVRDQPGLAERVGVLDRCRRAPERGRRLAVRHRQHPAGVAVTPTAATCT